MGFQKKKFSYEATLDNVLQSLHGQLIGFHSFNLFLKICNEEAFLSSSGNSGHILAPKFDTVSFPNNVVLMFLEARTTKVLTTKNHLRNHSLSCSSHFLESEKFLS